MSTYPLEEWKGQSSRKETGSTGDRKGGNPGVGTIIYFA